MASVRFRSVNPVEMENVYEKTYFNCLVFFLFIIACAIFQMIVFRYTKVSLGSANIGILYLTLRWNEVTTKQESAIPMDIVHETVYV